VDKLIKMVESEVVMGGQAVRAHVWTLALAYYYAAGQMLNMLWHLQASGKEDFSKGQETRLAALSAQVTDGLRKVGRLGGNGQHNPGPGTKGQAETLCGRLSECFPG
jgi:hypothetical protein